MAHDEKAWTAADDLARDGLWAEVDRVLAELDPPANYGGPRRPAGGVRRADLPAADRRAVEPPARRLRRR